MRMITRRCIEKQKDLYIASMDYERAFDRVKHEETMQDLQTIGFDEKEIVERITTGINDSNMH